MTAAAAAAMECKHMIEEILLRLPLKSLIRFKCLSKKWNSFISNNLSFRRDYFSRLPPPSPPLFLGFFVSRNYPPSDAPNQVSFIHTHTEGEKLKSAVAQPLDESLTFLGHPPDTIFIVASSNGFLLCSLEEFFPETYIICNPLTKDWVALPMPTFTSELLPTGFMCKPNYPSLSLRSADYTVVRGLCPDSRAFFTSFTMEIFSSKDFNWRVVNIECPSPFRLQLPKHYVVLSEKGLVYWLAMAETMGRRVLVYDPSKKYLQLVATPEGQRYSQCLTMSDGRIVYARFLGEAMDEFEVWVLEDTDHRLSKKRKKYYTDHWWSLKHQGKLRITDSPRPLGYFSLINLHPNNPALFFLSTGVPTPRQSHDRQSYDRQTYLISYDSQTSQFQLISNLGTRHYFYYPYVLPYWPQFLL